MAIEGNYVEYLAAVLQDIHPTAQQRTLLDLGIVNVIKAPPGSSTIFRTLNNYGGTLKPMNRGENIPLHTAGVDYQDKVVTTLPWGDGLSEPASSVLGKQSMRSLDPSAPAVFEEVLNAHLNKITDEVVNTIHLHAVSALMPTHTITDPDDPTKSITHVNPGITADNWITGSAPFNKAWSDPTADIPGQLMTIKDNFFGTSMPAQSLTILLSSKQLNNLCKNENVIKHLGFFNSSAGYIPLSLMNRQVVIQHLRGLGINLIPFDDTYYATDNTNSLTRFWSENHISVIPGSYYLREANGGITEVGVGRGSGYPFLNVITSAPLDFGQVQWSAGRNVSKEIMSPVVAQAFDGIYFASGWDSANPSTINRFMTCACVQLGFYAEEKAKIRYVQVQS